MNLYRIRTEIIKIGKKLRERGFIVATEGNISFRVAADKFLVTASGVDKGELTEEDVILIDRTGKPVMLGRKVSTEIKLHLKVYEKRPDIQAIIHAHPPYCISLMCAGYGLDKPLLPESVVMLGKVPIAPYATPSTEMVPESIVPYITRTDCILLDRHGSLTAGQSLSEAFLKLEIMENAAKIYWQALQIGSIRELSPQEVQILMQLRSQTYKLNWPIIPFFEE